jgi:hypothetical protein
VQVDLVDQATLEELSTDRRREDLQVLAAGGLEPDAHGLGHVTVQEGDSLGGGRERPGRGTCPSVTG